MIELPLATALPGTTLPLYRHVSFTEPRLAYHDIRSFPFFDARVVTDKIDVPPGSLWLASYLAMTSLMSFAQKLFYLSPLPSPAESKTASTKD